MKILQIYSQGLGRLLPGSPCNFLQCLTVSFPVYNPKLVIVQIHRSLHNNTDEADASNLEKLEKLLTDALRITESKKVL